MAHPYAGVPVFVSRLPARAEGNGAGPDDPGRGRRARWLILAAWAIGGTGIWVMHFVAMVGYSITGSQVRFDLRITLASWLIAIIVVGIGLFIVGYASRPRSQDVVAGLFMGSAWPRCTTPAWPRCGWTGRRSRTCG